MTIKKFQGIDFKTVDDYRTVLPRLNVGLVFLSEGLQKFLFPEFVGAGCFEKIGFANTNFMASFVAFFEITCSTLIFIGITVRISEIPLLIIMLAPSLKGTELYFDKLTYDKINSH